MKEYKRSARVAELLREEISKIISTELKDPKIVMSTVSEVRITDDLRFAKVFVSVIGSEKEIEESLAGLNRAKNYVRSELRKKLNLRSIPDINFVHDASVKYARNIEDLLNKISRENE